MRRLIHLLAVAPVLALSCADRPPAARPAVAPPAASDNHLVEGADAADDEGSLTERTCVRVIDGGERVR